MKKQNKFKWFIKQITKGIIYSLLEIGINVLVSHVFYFIFPKFKLLK